MTYKITMPDGTTSMVEEPNFIKMNPRYPSFICCGFEDAECVLLQDGEEQIQYNVNRKKYPEYETVMVEST